MIKKNKLIYKICHKSEWEKAKNNGIFKGSSKDILDGYIHFSSKDQVKSTYEKYFLNQKNLIIIEVDTKILNNLSWEKSRDDLLFPHLYSDLDVNSVKKIYKIKIQKDGSCTFPDNL